MRCLTHIRRDCASPFKPAESIGRSRPPQGYASARGVSNYDFLYLDKTKMKKFDTAQKIDAIVDAAKNYDRTYEAITYEEALLSG